jgi:uncharacterized FlaG/YvyC family protein
MSNHNPNFSSETINTVAPETITEDLIELDAYDDIGRTVRLILNKEINRLYVEVDDTLSEQLYAIPVPAGKKHQKIFKDPDTYQRLAKISAGMETAIESKTFTGRADAALLEEIAIPAAPKLKKRRKTDGIDVALYVDEATGIRTVSVIDTKDGSSYFSLEARTEEEGEDMFVHPYSYQDRQKIVPVYGFEQELEN